ncbi:hypothetical protein HHK36_019840 [Tetracentron sinense]|uniref:Uncharacterized protein n=1 Tax=Tetracentron sinense TaxID=13715 RepID=A0A834YWY0_TETSI|nr:hypothetical protein HHK36_019840 [Tetracentron sinense]
MDESEGAVTRTYQGFRKCSLGVVQFDTSKNRFLPAGDDFSIKFWDMDNNNLLTTIDGDGGLPASPGIRFYKEGALLAVSANENGIKILSNADGLRLLRTFESRSFDASRVVSETPTIGPISAVVAATSSELADRGAPMVAIAGMNGETRNLGDVKPKLTEEANDKSKIWKLTEINEPTQCRSLRLPDNLRTTKIFVFTGLYMTQFRIAVHDIVQNSGFDCRVIHALATEISEQDAFCTQQFLQEIASSNRQHALRRGTQACSSLPVPLM